MIIKSFEDVKLIKDSDVEKIHRASMQILEEIGIQVNHPHILEVLRGGGAKVDMDKKEAKLPEAMVMDAVKKAKKVYSLHGRDPKKIAWTKHAHAVFESSSGQYSWVENDGLNRRPPILADATKAIRLADALEEIDIVGAFVVPTDVPIEIKDVYLARELMKHTTKPVGLWMNDGKTADYVLKIFETAVGGPDVLKEKPITEAYMEPVSPLRYSKESLEILIEFAKRSAPVCFGPVPMAMATAPTTAVGTVLIASTEILAGTVMAQLLQPGMPIAYWGAQQSMDPTTGNVAFSAPIQGTMSALIVQTGQYYGFPVSSTVAFSDSNQADHQNGVERAASYLMAIAAGCNICGHVGIWGGDQGASLAQLVLDNEMASHIHAMLKEVTVDDESLGIEAIKRAGIGGNFLADEHTINNFRDSLWFGTVYNHDSWDTWTAKGRPMLLDKAVEKAEKIEKEHKSEPLPPDVEKEIDALVEEAHKKFVGK